MRFTSSCRSTPLKDVQTDTAMSIDRPTTKGTGRGQGKAKGKGKGKAKAVGIAVGDAVSFAGNTCHLLLIVTQYDPPCERCTTEFPCVASLGLSGRITQACSRCFLMKVKCRRPVANTLPQMAAPVRSSRPQSKAAPPTQGSSHSRATRSASRARPPTPVLESEDTTDDTGESFLCDSLIIIYI